MNFSSVIYFESEVDYCVALYLNGICNKLEKLDVFYIIYNSN